MDGHQALGTANVADMFFHEPIQGAVPGRCDEESVDTARLAYFWNLPLFTRTGTSSGLNDRTFYPTVAQVNLEELNNCLFLDGRHLRNYNEPGTSAVNEQARIHRSQFFLFNLNIN